MKRYWLFPVAIILIMLACWLSFNLIRHGGAGNKELHENPESPGMKAAEYGSGTLPIKIFTDSGKSSENYLSPLYEVNVHQDIVYASKKNETDAAEPLTLDLYEPVEGGTAPRPVFIFIHGGGYKEGVKEDAGEISMELARRGYAVLSMNYRLKSVPFANFQKTLSDAYEDIMDVITWVRLNEKTYSLNSGRIALGGDSAGGYLAINFANEYLKQDPSFVKPIFALIDLYGGTLESEAHPNLPPVLMIHGTNDAMIPYEQSVVLASNLDRAGIYNNLFTMEGVGHDYKDPRYFSEITETTAYFLWNVMGNPEHEWLPKYTGIVAASGDRIDISLPERYVHHTVNRAIRVTLPEGWELGEQTDQAVLSLQLPSGLQRGNRHVHIALEEYGEEGLQEFGLSVNVVDPIRVGYETYFSRNEQLIKTRLQLTNQSNRDYRGLVRIEYSTYTKKEQCSFSRRVDLLEPGQSIVMDIPELAGGKRLLSVFDASGGIMQKTESQASVLVVPKLKQEIRIDGRLKDWSDASAAAFQVNEQRMKDWTGMEDLSATGTISWDQKNLYLGLQVADDVHRQTDEGGEIWRGDGVQIGIGIANDDGSVPQQYHEFGLAMQDEAHLTKWRWIAPRGFGAGEPESLDFAVRRSEDAGITFYEAAIPWTELIQDSELIHPGLKLKFSLLVNDNDGAGRKGWLEYNSGIGTSKDANLFGDIFLME
ncbi:alpha/beta hydrolase fold domain-containing protein [Paenibacillus sp. MSJ-6]|uniref:Alpha/beta hydrolase fold domain-containing protein n=2 Tax=Paenibacillus brevis TaxID=2841508 RepID=A0ABS6FQZ4_9BACL|nr:alpha/beta hydrolase fold domain-containing protein [Paenibacillus brevis]